MKRKRGPYEKATQRFLNYLRDQRHSSPHTVRAYEIDLEQFGAFLSPPQERGVAPGPEEIDRLAVRGFVAGLHHEGLGKASIARKLSTIRSFLRHALREGRIGSNPAKTVATPKIPRGLPRNLTVDETFNLLEHIKDDDIASVRDRSILELLYATGLRVGELTSLGLGDVSLVDSIVRVVGKGGKERLVPFGSKSASALKKWLDRSKALRGKSDSDAIYLNLRGG